MSELPLAYRLGGRARVVFAEIEVLKPTVATVPFEINAPVSLVDHERVTVAFDERGGEEAAHELRATHRSLTLRAVWRQTVAGP